MITVIHMEHAKISAISNLWFARYPAEWRRMLAVANALDVPLLALVYQRLRELQGAAAREAFMRQEDFGVVTWEWREQIVKERLAALGQFADGQNRQEQVRGIVTPKNRSAGAGGEWPPQ